MPGRSTNVGYGYALYKFTGKERDREAGIGLDYFGARYYDPEIGRWLGVDPLSEQFPAVSPFIYALNNPLRLRDVAGLFPGEFYTIEGTYLGSDEIGDKKIYITSQKTVTENTEATVGETGLELNTNWTQVKQSEETKYTGTYSDFVKMNGYTISSEALQRNLVGLSIYIANIKNIDYPTIYVTSGDRGTIKNLSIGGAKRSRHLVGDAADIVIQGFDNFSAAQLAYSSGLFSKTIWYPKYNAYQALRPHVHVDLRPNAQKDLFKYTPSIETRGYPWVGRFFTLRLVTRHAYKKIK